MDKIEILDCTLRDGGYVNNWEFEDSITIDIINSLLNAKIEMIECGFISHSKGKEQNSTLFKSIDVINHLLQNVQKAEPNQAFICLLNYGECDVNAFPKCDKSNTNSVTGLRVAFHKENIDGAYSDVKILMEKGYDVFVQPMVTMRYKDVELLNLIEKFNNLDPFAIYIVDSFGSMSLIDFQRFYFLFENNVRKGIRIGYHSHNNLQLAFSNAVSFTAINKNNKIILDSSIYGMGRGAGNLNTELVADFLNKNQSKNYEISFILDVIESYLIGIFRENSWGFSPAFFLSASFECHPNYASFLTNKKTISIVEIKKILAEIDSTKKSTFDKEYVTELYINFNKNKLNNKIIRIPEYDREILILASGPSVVTQRDIIDSYIDSNNPIIITLNHVVEGIDSDYYFFSNQKRYNQYAQGISNSRLIVSSNIKIKSNNKNCYVVDYGQMLSNTISNLDNVAILFLSHLVNNNVKSVAVAGLDGYKLDSINNYSYVEYDRTIDRKTLKKRNENIKNELNNLQEKIDIDFITNSIFKTWSMIY